MTPRTVPAVDIDRVNRQQNVLQALADPTSRTILRLISAQTMTAAEVIETIELPTSTGYRKLNQLLETQLVEAEYRLSSDGKHPRQFQCKVSRVCIQLPTNDRPLAVRLSCPRSNVTVR